MSEATATAPATLPTPTATAVRSGWRRAFLVFALLGVIAYGVGWWAMRDDSGSIPSTMMILIVMFGPLLAVLGFGGWWVIFGDGRWWNRVLAVFALGCVGVGALIAADSSMLQFVLAWGVPLTAGITGLALVAIPAARRGWVGALIVLVAIAPWLLFRADGVDGKYMFHTSYRWQRSVADMAADQLADRATVAPVATTTDLAPATEADWPGFRGANRTGEVPEAAFRGWDGSKPRERWRNEPVGPAWSSFCAVDDFIFTQEQRGNSESVVCYRADTGKEVWAHGEAGKHTDQMSGPGPRATPTYANGKLYVVGANGVVSCLRASNGEQVWSANLIERFGATKPNFGLSSSPLVVGDLVIIHPGSPTGPRVVAVDAATGATRWAAEATGALGYSSPQAATIAGTAQVLVFNNTGLFAHDPQTGRELWRYDWVVGMMEPSSVQPLVLPDGRVVVGGGNKGTGTRCVKVQREGDKWTATEAWKSKFTPIFNDVVRVGGHLFGLDSGRLVCVDLKDGAVKWKEGDYGSGQVLLAGDKLLVVSEKGQLACVAASAEEYDEQWKMDVAKGKTWNHPAIARGRLYYRNPTVMVAFDLPGYRVK